MGFTTVLRPETADEGRQAVAQQAPLRPDFIKIWVDDGLGHYPKMKPEVFTAIIDEAHKQGLRVAAHLYYREDARALVAAGVDVIAHSIRNGPIDDALIALMTKNHVAYIPTLSLDEFAFAYESSPAWINSRFFRAALDPGVLDLITSPDYKARTRASSETEGAASSMALASWYFGRHPDLEVFIASHSAALSSRFSRQAREAMAQHGEAVFGVKLSEKSASVENWELVGHAGAFHSAGIGGTLVGLGASLFILDDYLASSEAADSAIEREKARDWFMASAMTRLSSKPQGAMLIIGTRRRPDDLVGWLLEEEKNGGEHWEVLSLPMVDDTGEHDVHTGPILWSERYSREDVEKIRKRSSRDWEAQYQCRPSNPAGTILKRDWFRHYSVAPTKFQKMLTVWDCSFKSTKDSDFVVGQVWGRVGADAYLLDQVRARMDFPQTQAAVKALAKKWGPLGAHRILVEGKANGSAIIDALRRDVPGLVPLATDLVQAGKESRLNRVSAFFESFNVHFPAVATHRWVLDLEDELAAFPFGTHDDQADAVGYALANLMTGTTSYYTGALVKSPRQIRLEAGMGDNSARDIYGRPASWDRPDHSGDTDSFNSGRRC
jgi:predicted phage terminase large subunit-like protein